MLSVRFVFLFVFINMLAGCSKHPYVKKQGKELTCAKQQDIALPAGYKLKTYTSSEKSTLFIYSGNLNIDAVIKFYKKDLELNGWSYTDFSTKLEGLLSASKTSMKCIISVRPNKANTFNVYLSIQKTKLADPTDTVTDINRVNKTT